jgi:tRNA nucleotidyltransferase (CCA-adding enzyme)
LRILRALRFSSVLDFEIDAATAESVHENKELLANISAERIRDEFFKLVTGKGAERVLLDFPDVICEFIPELRAAVGFNQKNPFHAYDVYTHSVKAISAADGDLYVKLALFFHDIGKPACFTEDEHGGHFYGHQDISANITEIALRRLHAGNETTAIVTRLVKEHHKVIQNSEKGIRRLLSSLGEENARRLIALRRGDNSALIPELKEPRLAELDETARLLDEEIKKKCCLSLRNLAITGDDLIVLGMKPGREIGRLLAGLLDAVIDGSLPNEREVLLAEAEKRITVQ